MFNIHFMGEYDDEKQLIHKDILPDGAIMFEAGERISDAARKGMLIVLPILFIMVIIGIKIAKQISGQLFFDQYFFIR